MPTTGTKIAPSNRTNIPDLVRDRAKKKRPEGRFRDQDIRRPAPEIDQKA